MRIVSNTSKVLFVLALLGASAGLAAQPRDTPESGVVTVTGQLPDPATMTPGPKVEGIISARTGDRIQVATADGGNAVLTLTDATRVRSSNGFLGLERSELQSGWLINGLPVTVETLQWDGGLVASKVSVKDKDLRTASMIRNGTDQRFGQHDVAIAENAQATEALRGRMGDIDQYNVKGTTEVHFATGQATLSAQDQAQLCATAQQAESMDNALLLVVGYTDSTGDIDYNQDLSERRAGRVVNYLQQNCGWKPYRMLTPTGMSEADPAASNDTVDGKAQNRRVAVNILVSKGLDGL